MLTGFMHSIEDGSDHSACPICNGPQGWYWTPEWQAGEREVDAEIAAGRTRTFDNADDLIAWLMEPEEC